MVKNSGCKYCASLFESILDLQIISSVNDILTNLEIALLIYVAKVTLST